MKKALRISCILLLTVLIFTANTVFSSAVHEKEAVDLREALTVADEKHGAYASRLTDGMYNTRVSYADGEKVSVSCGTEIGCAFIAWQSMPSKVSIAWMDKEGKTIANEEWTPARLDDYIDVSQPGVCGYTLTFQKACSVSELGAYTAGELSDDLPRFEAPLKKPAVMLITGYPGDELACFGGLLPSLINMGVPVQVVYINPYNRNRQEECLRTLWKLGMRNEPIFLDTAGIRSLDSTVLKSTLEKNGEVSKKLLNVLESCCPSVIVTHGKNRQFPLMSESEAAYKVVTGDYVYKKIKNQSWLKKIYLVAEKGDSKGQKFDFSDGYDQAAALLKEGYVSMRTFHYTPYGDDTYILHFDLAELGLHVGGNVSKELVAVGVDFLNVHGGDDQTQLTEENIGCYVADVLGAQAEQTLGGVGHAVRLGADTYGKAAGDVNADVLLTQGVGKVALDADRSQVQERIALEHRPDERCASVDTFGRCMAAGLTVDYQNLVGGAAFVACKNGGKGHKKDHHQNKNQIKRHSIK